jgi:dsDNA-specific endonuclease/ATPase MutS2
MGTNKKQGKNSQRSAPPARNLENRENQLIEMAYNRAEERLRDGTATAQEIVHFLKMGTAKAQLEKKKLEAETELLMSKKDAVESAKRSEVAIDAAMKAFREYTGQDED